VLRELEEVKRRIGETANRRSNSGDSNKLERWITNDPASLRNYARAGQRPTTRSTSSGQADDRAARFVCVIALASPEKVIATFRGEVYGRIGYESKGSGGFGYDPVFIPDGHDKTFAELGSDIKDKISHRANALMKLNEYLNIQLGAAYTATESRNPKQ
jgi:hypothetical protein